MYGLTAFPRAAFSCRKDVSTADAFRGVSQDDAAMIVRYLPKRDIHALSATGSYLFSLTRPWRIGSFFEARARFSYCHTERHMANEQFIGVLAGLFDPDNRVPYESRVSILRNLVNSARFCGFGKDGKLRTIRAILDAGAGMASRDRTGLIWKIASEYCVGHYSDSTPEDVMCILRKASGTLDTADATFVALAFRTLDAHENATSPEFPNTCLALLEECKTLSSEHRTTVLLHWFHRYRYNYHVRGLRGWEKLGPALYQVLTDLPAGFEDLIRDATEVLRETGVLSRPKDDAHEPTLAAGSVSASKDGCQAASSISPHKRAARLVQAIEKSFRSGKDFNQIHESAMDEAAALPDECKLHIRPYLNGGFFLANPEERQALFRSMLKLGHGMESINLGPFLLELARSIRDLAPAFRGAALASLLELGVRLPKHTRAACLLGCRITVLERLAPAEQALSACNTIIAEARSLPVDQQATVLFLLFEVTVELARFHPGMYGVSRTAIFLRWPWIQELEALLETVTVASLNAVARSDGTGTTSFASVQTQVTG